MLVTERKISYTTEKGKFPGDLGRHLSSEAIIHEVLIGAMRTPRSEASPDEPLYNILRRDSAFPGIQTYCYISWSAMADTRFTVRLTHDILATAGLTETEVWIAAEKNTFGRDEFTAEPMDKFLSDLLGENMPPIDDDSFRMYIISNRNRIRGAVQIFNSKALTGWARKHGYEKLIVLPSSIHEVIVIPADDSPISLEQMNMMVCEVNEQEIPPREQLSDRAYIIDIPDETAAA